MPAQLHTSANISGFKENFSVISTFELLKISRLKSIDKFFIPFLLRSEVIKEKSSSTTIDEHHNESALQKSTIALLSGRNKSFRFTKE